MWLLDRYCKAALSTSSPHASIALVLVAAGRGLRAGGDGPKQYRKLNGRSVLAQSLKPFLALPGLTSVVVVIGTGDEERYRAALQGVDPGGIAITRAIGGETRQDSVRLGLEHLAAAGFDGSVLVHDAARPFVTRSVIRDAVAALHDGAIAAIPALPVTDTIKRLDAERTIAETPPRDSLVSVQTPQAFRFRPLLDAHRAAAARAASGFTDDSALMEWAGHAVATFPGDPANIKLTYPEDFMQADGRGLILTTRVATGYDVHAFTTGDHVWLGGVRIAHDRGVLAHSDGDVALHALTDALLGALAEGDIGTHFPPSDEQWRGASSDRFLAFAAGRVRDRGGRIDHLDLSIVCEAPRLGPHREAIRQRIAGIAGLDPSRVSLKATTSEKLGFVGRREGLAALATATIRLPDEG